MPPLEEIMRHTEEEEAEERRLARRHDHDESGEGSEAEIYFLPEAPGGDDETADLTADIYPAIPSGHKRGLRLTDGGTRLSVADLEGHHLYRGRHPGDK